MCSGTPAITKTPKPIRGTYKTQVTITGTGFCDEQGTGKVTFTKGTTEVPADIVTWSDTQIVLTVPWGCKVGINKVKVTNASESASNIKKFTFIKPVSKITTLSSNSGAIGSEITITGKNFGVQDNASKVLFGNTQADLSSATWTNESIVVTVPPILNVPQNGKGVLLKVKTLYGLSNTKLFKVLPAQ